MLQRRRDNSNEHLLNAFFSPGSGLSNLLGLSSSAMGVERMETWFRAGVIRKNIYKEALE